jgi:hypothetical protein
MADGTTKPIADVKPGDSVEAADPATGRRGARRVTALHDHVDEDLIDLVLRGTDGSVHTVHTTSRHPFWDGTAKAWRAAARLAAGHALRSSDGADVTVVRVLVVPGHAHMLNLTVDDLHTYFVMSGSAAVLVHNTCGGEMIGEGGTQTTSTTLTQNSNFHIDVENPAPGSRPGQLHLQDYAGNKYQFNFETREFEGLPRSLAKQVANDPKVVQAIQTGLKYLGMG